MSWQVLMLLQNVFASAYALQSRQLARKYKSAHFQILAVTFVIMYLVFICYALINVSSISLITPLQFGGTIVLTGLYFTVWTVLTFLVYRFVDAAIGTLLTTLNLIAVIVTASILLGESLTLLQGVGAVLLLGSIFIISSAHLSKIKQHNLVVAISLSLIASVFFGLAIANEKYLLDHMGAPTYLIFGVGAQVVPLLLLAFLYKPREFRHFKQVKFRKNVIIMGLTRAGAGLLFILSLVLANNASLIGVLSGLKIILTTILAAILLKEVMLMKRKIVASVIAFFGVGILLW